jgi:hypothetical protein
MTATAQKDQAWDLLERFLDDWPAGLRDAIAAALSAARQEERERIAKVWDVDPRDTDGAMYSGQWVADVIRAGGTP